MQTYEEYWKLTNAFTDYNGKKFINTLAVCVKFIDTYKNEPYSEGKYNRLQLEVQQVNNINLISVRKSINQLVKMGFINSYLVSYHPQSAEYIAAKTNVKRETLLSKIVYSNASFNRAVNEASSIKQLNFLIQTLAEIGKLSKAEIIALMLVDIEIQQEAFISYEELQDYVQVAQENGFIARKYNQIGYLCNILGKLDDLVFVGDDLYFKEDAEELFGADSLGSSSGRDPYLHRLYKNQLMEESTELYGKPLCYFEKLAYPVLIASHIKPFINSNEEESYDPNNGLLLSRTIDSLFDLKYISFTDEGELLFSKRLSADVKEFWKEYRLDSVLLNEARKKYLAYHRNLFNKLDV
jgi:hypothetical protein